MFDVGRQLVEQVLHKLLMFTKLVKIVRNLPISNALSSDYILDSLFCVNLSYINNRGKSAESEQWLMMGEAAELWLLRKSLSGTGWQQRSWNNDHTQEMQTLPLLGKSITQACSDTYKSHPKGAIRVITLSCANWNLKKMCGLYFFTMELPSHV